jgi:Asp-tRNA(Asn)/Glu-tRNA(Gln) amidotransferase A subunit family amidase
VPRRERQHAAGRQAIKSDGAHSSVVLNDASLAATVDDLRRGRTAPVDHVETLETRAAAVEPDIAAFVDETDRWERVRTAAVDCASRHADGPERPPLYGVPVGVKDVFHVDGLETRAGSDLPPGTLDGGEATAVTRLRAAGAFVLGKTVTAEFAYFDPGPTRNPCDTDHTPGGSSSGSAAAVAAGLCPLALGTQTIGSVARPAAFCGVVGVKPTYDRVPTDGVVPVSPAVDTVGWFTQDVEGARLAGAVLCDDWRTLAEPRERPTLGVPGERYLDQADAVGREAFDAQVDRLADAGYDVERVDVLGDIAAVNGRHERLMAAEMAAAHEAWYREYADRYAAATRELIERGHEVTGREIARARQGRHDLRETLETRMDRAGVDLWVTPAAPGPAPEGIDDTGDPVMNLPWTHAGLPVVSVPADEHEGLPLGLQCVARASADEDLLAWVEGVAAVV